MRSVVFSRKGFPRKNLCSCSLFDLLLLRSFITSGIRAEGFKIGCPGRLSAALPGQHPSQRRLDQQQQVAASCSFIKPIRQVAEIDSFRPRANFSGMFSDPSLYPAL